MIKQLRRNNFNVLPPKHNILRNFENIRSYMSLPQATLTNSQILYVYVIFLNTLKYKLTKSAFK